jgi:pyruvate/2-oxoacid:ferredoxin oxidoreductase beta subunit
MKKATDTYGTKFILIFSPCPTGWRYSPELTIRVAKLATETGIFPLYEIENGEKYSLNRKRLQKPVREYTSLQGRFRGLSEEDLRKIKNTVRKDWEYLKRMAG